MTSQQYEQTQALKRLARTVKSNYVRYVGSVEDMLTAGIIGPHMIAEPKGGLLEFRYGVKWSGDWGAGGVCTVVRHEDGKLAAWWWVKSGDTSPGLDSARPCWRLDRQANVVQLPFDAPTQGRDGEKPFPGVVAGLDWHDDDTYRGGADCLVAAGLVTPEQLPGQPGGAKMMMSFLPDGTRIKKGSRAPDVAGCKRVTKERNGDFVVTISVGKEERMRRWKGRNAIRESRITPAPTVVRAPHLRLVWSTPN